MQMLPISSLDASVVVLICFSLFCFVLLVSLFVFRSSCSVRSIPNSGRVAARLMALLSRDSRETQLSEMPGTVVT